MNLKQHIKSDLVKEFLKKKVQYIKGSKGILTKQTQNYQINAKTIWLTGLSASGKSTIAQELANSLQLQNQHVSILDGDQLRTGLCSDLDFSLASRTENVRRVAEVAKLTNQAGTTVITALISPLEKDRQMARTIIGSSNFFEVFVHTPLEICEQRDPKGLYQKARQGIIPDFTGIDSPYESPEKPELQINTTELSPSQASTLIQEKVFRFFKN